jgi:hypothetical protein
MNHVVIPPFLKEGKLGLLTRLPKKNLPLIV